jgi:hypothetical protein
LLKQREEKIYNKYNNLNNSITFTYNENNFNI